jgi:broad specificity phosphatase PhoE
MSETFPVVYLARHGETAWTITGQHTGLIDLPLTEHGEANARRLGVRLAGIPFNKVFTSPLKRTRRTCELAGFGKVAELNKDLVEWNYGTYEGLLRVDILRERPDWQLFRDGCPDGESPQQVAERAESRRSAHTPSGGKRPIVFRRTFSPSAGHTLDWDRTHQWPGVHAQHSEPELPKL